MKKFLIPSILLIVLLGFLSTAIAQNTITPEQAPNFIGQTETVCGQVASTHFACRVRGQPTFLNLDKPYPQQIFTILIWGSDRGKFQEPPEMEYAGKKICVTGSIKSYHGRPEIVVQEPGQIKVR